MHARCAKSQSCNGRETGLHRYDDHYFLSEAWWPDVITGYELVKTDKERALIKELSVGQSKPAKKKRKVTIKMVNP